MKDKIELKKAYDNKGNEVLHFYVHCDLGTLYLHTWTFSKGVYMYFKDGRSVDELFSYRYTCNKRLNKVVDRLPGYIRFAKRCERDEREWLAAREKEAETERAA